MRPGENVFNYGEYGNKFYVIIKGKVNICIPDPKKKAEVNKQHEGGGGGGSSGLKPNNSESIIKNAIFNGIKMLSSPPPSGLPTKQNSRKHSILENTSMRPSLRNSSVNPFSGRIHAGSNIIHIDEHDEDVPVITDTHYEVKVENGSFNSSPSVTSGTMITLNHPQGDQIIKDIFSDQELAETPRRLKEYGGFSTIAQLKEGQAFGELALIQQKPRMATVRCVRKTHMIVLTKEAFDSVIGKMERRILNDKINFLRNIPVFKLLTKNSLAKITCSLGRSRVLKDSYLYKEGDPAKSVFIVISGEFEVIKTIVYYNKVEESVDNIFKDPLKANKKTNLMFMKNAAPKHQRMNVSYTTR